MGGLSARRIAELEIKVRGLERAESSKFNGLPSSEIWLRFCHEITLGVTYLLDHGNGAGLGFVRSQRQGPLLALRCCAGDLLHSLRKDRVFASQNPSPLTGRRWRPPRPIIHLDRATLTWPLGKPPTSTHGYRKISLGNSRNSRNREEKLASDSKQRQRDGRRRRKPRSRSQPSFHFGMPGRGSDGITGHRIRQL